MQSVSSISEWVCLRTNHKPKLVYLACLALCACRADGDDTDAVQSVTETRAFPSDEVVLAKVYDNTYQVPSYFFVDERADTPQSYSLYHVKDQSISYELCTNDYNEALQWEAADNDNRAANGLYVGSYENEKYFEFVRELSYTESVGNISDLTSPGYARIFKCSYINRDGVDRNLRDGYAGTLNVEPLTEQSVSTFSEYLWQYTFFWPTRKKVLETFSFSQEGILQHTLVLALLTNRGTDACDLIEIVDWVFSVNRSNGEATKTFNYLYQLEAQLVNGIPEKCSSSS